ncbi:hypothetical protein FHS26_004465 [Rhizobium pisi]|uniref:Uncharacterized protein n=1 Tax=Rhizobium pisi TaxID=574561 RepID=A0A7W5BRG9_9HYPH|nr:MULTISPECIES: hypothetical protein [Rhizobium]MBB3136708.1 hypothetical protein [Rhizobium pisi]MBY5361979.1 hypothetical protein [Rhizobium leguminosarum]MBY5530988.1 hypothetical protein [Rhizobium leguminosarum]MBY5665009.1 hypothetical protein [Rhizobium leguminosarum]MBY5679958.1 hypothetical protein [Rhizobium leguminosarum]
MRGTRPGINYVFLVKWIASRGVIEVTWRLIIAGQRFAASDQNSLRLVW